MNLRRWIAAVAVALVLLGGWLWWRRPAVQAPKTFAALARAIEEGDAGGVLGRVHPQYDFRGLWPGQFGAGEDFGVREPRQLAFLGLRVLFQHHQQDPISVAWEVHDVAEQADGTCVVTATLRLSTASGTMMIGPKGPLERHRFVLARDGWSAALFVRGHDPIAVER